ncbi:hypothetical protein BJP40_01940 [Streptomyces sp. CC53]|uniref:DUF1203 domain-containing protein n=1 Tax=unclassified Streptomyces TaxID=2593676 RepID=UPI0008DE67C5|nr:MULTISPECIES: DUF1203 domain-containing protein [unclassified Streptomyces]OII64745.1 hypothetical protein BJP40_01940 [Streptomyces sp. CC53]OII69073.1 hypothetical protein BJP39_18880 [Streptomyces sp. CC77]
MTAYTVLPVDPAALKELRVTDDAGRPCVPYLATGDDAGSPLRCCLRPVAPGERIALVSYAPLRRWAAARGVDPGAYDEQGPVFVHADDCGGLAPGAGYPSARPGALRTVRRYDARGRIAGGRLLKVPADATAAFDAAFDDAFADPDVVLVHVRAVEYGCFHFEVRRPSAEDGTPAP